MVQLSCTKELQWMMPLMHLALRINHQGSFQQADFLWNNAGSFKLNTYAGSITSGNSFTTKIFKSDLKNIDITNFLISAYFYCI